MKPVAVESIAEEPAGRTSVRLLAAIGFLCLIEALALAVLPVSMRVGWLQPLGVMGSLSLGAAFLAWSFGHGVDLGWSRMPMRSPARLRESLRQLLRAEDRREVAWTVFLNALLVVSLLVAVLPLLAIVRSALALATDQSSHGVVDYLGYFFSFIALLMGSLFFVYSIKYYLGTAIVLLSTAMTGNRSDTGAAHRGTASERGLKRIRESGNATADFDLGYHPFISVQIASYNEKRVIERLLECCALFEYPNYEVIWVDDSTDESDEIRERWQGRERFKVIHRQNRAGYKGGALTEALKAMDRRAEYVVIFDADAMPFPDALQRFLPHFYAKNGHVKKRDEIAAVQSYQWHVLNKSESWLTEAVRTEYAGSYMVERPFQDMLGSLKMIAGTAYMIRAELLRELGWGKSLTEDWELTLRLYARGYKVVYTPYAETPAECVSTFGRLARQRMRWAEGHSYNVRKWFGTIMRSPHVSLVEKVEFGLYSTYYLQAVFFVVGSLSWGLAEIGFKVHIPEWTALLGWSLMFSNLVALPMMNLSGLLLEEAPGRDLSGVLGAWALSLGLVPYQGYAALKGLFEKEEGPWFRTPKTGRVTDEASHLRKLGRVRRWLLGAPRGRVPVVSRIQGSKPPRRSRRLGWVVIGAMTLALGGLGAGAVNAPVAQAAGSTFYTHGDGTSMDYTTGAAVQGSLDLTTGATRTWATTTRSSVAQTIPAGNYTYTYYLQEASGSVYVNLKFGWSATGNCAAQTTIVAGNVNLTAPAAPNGPGASVSVTSVASVVVPANSYFCWTVTWLSDDGGNCTGQCGGPLHLLYGHRPGSVTNANFTTPSTISIPESGLPLLGIALAAPWAARLWRRRQRRRMTAI